MHELVGFTTLSQTATTSDLFALGQTATLGTVSTNQLTVSILFKRLDPCLWGRVLQGQTRPQGAVLICFVLLDDTVELLVLWLAPVLQDLSFTPTSGLATTGILETGASLWTIAIVMAFLSTL